MKLGVIGRLFPLMFRKVVYGYTAEAETAVISMLSEETKKRVKPE